MNTRSRRIARIPKHNTSTKIINIGYTVLKKNGNTFYRCDKCKLKFNTIPTVKSHLRTCNETSDEIIDRNCSSTTKITKNSAPSDATNLETEQNTPTSPEESQSDSRDDDDDDENNIKTEVNDEDTDNLYVKIERSSDIEAINEDIEALNEEIEALHEEIFTETLDIHLKAELTCKHCKEEFSSKSELSEHIKIHSKIFQCGVCDKILSSSQALNHHLSVQHNAENLQKIFQCGICDKILSSSYTLNNHLSVHSEEKQNEIKIRRSKTDNITEWLYKRHETISKIKPEKQKYYQCDICAKRYHKYKQMVRHLAIHGDNHPFKCKICSKVLSCSKFLKAHMRLHTGETPYQCEVCSKLFSFKHHLVKHMLQHDDIVKPFQCKICKKAYTTQTTLEKHLQTHTYKRHSYFICHECPTRYDDYFSLLEHRRVHDVPLHICPMCGKKYIKEANFFEHMKTHE